jgi:hypothetical protein
MSIAIIKFWQGTVEVTVLCCDNHFSGMHFATCLVIEARSSGREIERTML